jgi:hypothetical protein
MVTTKATTRHGKPGSTIWVYPYLLSRFNAYKDRMAEDKGRPVYASEVLEDLLDRAERGSNGK